MDSRAGSPWLARRDEQKIPRLWIEVYSAQKRCANNSLMRYSTLLCFGLLVAATPALAGFQWVAPAEDPTVPDVVVPVPSSQQTPQEAVEDIYAAERRTNRALTPAPVAPAPVAPVANEPITAQDTQVSPSASHNSTTEQSGEVNAVYGFGENLPLAIALREIVPAGFSYSFQKGVNAGTAVSWDGKGQSWTRVVADMLAPHGLIAALHGRVLMIAVMPQPKQETPKKETMAPPQTALAAEPIEALQPAAKTVQEPHSYRPANYITHKPKPVAAPTDAPMTLTPMPVQ